MPWRLIGFVFVLVIVVAFVALNLGNRTDISFAFAVIEDVPVFISLFAAFILGVVITLPITVASRRRKRLKASASSTAVPTIKADDRKRRRRDRTPEEPTAGGGDPAPENRSKRP